MRSYTTIEAFLIISWVEFIDKREFTKVGLDENFKFFVVHITTLEAILTYHFKTIQIPDKLTLAAL